MTQFSHAELFEAIRKVANRKLTQADVNIINAVLLGTVVNAAGGMLMSATGVRLVHSYEQLRLVAYKDPGSVNGLPITNGWGATRDLDGKLIKLGAVWTEAYANQVFEKNKREVESGVNFLLKGKKTTQNQFDALCSFAYNVGLDLNQNGKAEGLGESTLLRKHLAGDFIGAKAEFAKWNKNDGKVMAGLVRRRSEEAALYAKP